MEYNHLFPVANLNEKTVKKGATVSDTVKFIPEVVHETLSQTKAIAERLQGSTVSETCRNIWHFVYGHIAYHKDDEGKEQIRSPARTWHDRSRGVDCDCYTVFISSILTNLKIPHGLRIAKYKQDHFQHIYPVVPRSGRHITIDCVVEHFNYEEPYTEIKDTTMDLQYLSGLDDPDFSGDDEMGKLQLFKKKTASASTTPAPKKKGVLKKVIGKALNVVNKVNPATVLLRNGVLAAMKLNLMNVAGRLKYAYLSDAEAQKRNIDMAKFQKLKQIKDKLEKIFFGAGGKPENLKNAILTGKGNKNKEVSGLGYNLPEAELGDMDESTPLPQLLGEEMYHSENVEGMEDMDGLGELGEPVTAASITAASGALASLAALMKNIGSIFKGKQKGSEDFESGTSDSATNLPAEIEKNKEEISKMEIPSDQSDSSQSDSTSTSSETSKTSDSTSTDSGSGGDKQETFWDKNKKWLKPTLWGAGGLTLLALGYKMLSGKKEEAPPAKTLSGTKKKKPKNKKDEVALM